MNKYYTPEIEEFCVGFRFEKRILSSYGHQIQLEDVTWEKRELTPRCRIPKDKNTVTFYRVKHLDTEDIEELGWENPGEGDYEFGERWYMWEVGNSVYVIADEENEKGFRGTIKNYNQLQTLMKQLNIV